MAATVEQVHVHEDVPTIMVGTTGGNVETTATHPFYIHDRGWVPAGDLRQGDHLHTPTTTLHNNDTSPSEPVSVLSIQATGRKETVHNLTTTTHTYHVTTHQPGANPTYVLVHNQGEECGTSFIVDSTGIATDVRPTGPSYADLRGAGLGDSHHIRLFAFEGVVAEAY